MSRSRLVLAALLVFASAGCSSGPRKSCGPQDAGVFEVGVEIPAGCPPPQANELGIGTPCSMCGNECPSPLRCTCDALLGVQLVGVPCVCTLFQLAQTGSTNPCGDVPANFCGSNTTCCSVLTTAAYCVPNVCLIGGQCIVFTVPDAGTDAEPDAGTD